MLIYLTGFTMLVYGKLDLFPEESHESKRKSAGKAKQWSKSMWHECIYVFEIKHFKKCKLQNFHQFVSHFLQNIHLNAFQ